MCVCILFEQLRPSLVVRADVVTTILHRRDRNSKEINGCAHIISWYIIKSKFLHVGYKSLVVLAPAYHSSLFLTTLFSSQSKATSTVNQQTLKAFFISVLCGGCSFLSITFIGYLPLLQVSPHAESLAAPLRTGFLLCLHGTTCLEPIYWLFYLSH